MNPIEEFRNQCAAEISRQGNDPELWRMANEWIGNRALKYYSYHFTWLGRPIIQYPQDIVAMQEIIWEVKPDLIIETGIAHGGSLIFYASMLEINALCGGPVTAQVTGIDIDIRKHNREAIEKHPIYALGRINMLEGSSVDPDIIAKVYGIAEKCARIMVVLDSNHTSKHVLAELEAYAPIVSKGSYCVVFDTVIENMPSNAFPDKPWGHGDNPATAVAKFLKIHPDFCVEKRIEDKLLLTVAPNGYLKRLK